MRNRIIVAAAIAVLIACALGVYGDSDSSRISVDASGNLEVTGSNVTVNGVVIFTVDPLTTTLVYQVVIQDVGTNNYLFVGSLISDLTNDAGYLTSFSEIDGVFTNWLDTNTYVQVEVDPVWAAESNQYYLAANPSAYVDQSITNGFWETNSITNWVISQAYLTSFTEVDPIWAAESNLYYLTSNPSAYVTAAITNGFWHTNDITNWVISQAYLTSFTEVDPIWAAESNFYYLAANPSAYVDQSITNGYWHTNSITNWVISQAYLTSFTEVDPIWAAESNQYYLTSNPSAYVDQSITNGFWHTNSITNWVISQAYLTAETDPIWAGVSNSYLRHSWTGIVSAGGYELTDLDAGTGVSNAVNRQYVLNRIAAFETWYFNNSTTSSVSNYYTMNLNVSDSNKTVLSYPNVTNGQYLTTYITPAGLPAITELQKGRRSVHMNVGVSNGTAQLRAELHIADSSGVSRLLVDESSFTTNVLDAEAGYIMNFVISSNYPMAVDERLYVRLRANILSGTPNIQTITEGRFISYLLGQTGSSKETDPEFFNWISTNGVSGFETDPIWAGVSNAYILDTVTNVDAANRFLWDSSPIKSVDWGQRRLQDSANSSAIRWNDRTLNIGSTVHANWATQYFTNGIWRIMNNATVTWDIVNYQTLTNLIDTLVVETDPIWGAESNQYYLASNPSSYVDQSITNGYWHTNSITNWVISQAYLTVETDPIWAAESNQYYLASNPSSYVDQSITNGFWETNSITNWVISQSYLTTETDPIWAAESNQYYLVSNPSSYVDASVTNGFWHTNDITNWVISQSYLTTESDPIWSAVSSLYYFASNPDGFLTNEVVYTNVFNTTIMEPHNIQDIADSVPLFHTLEPIIIDEMRIASLTNTAYSLILEARDGADDSTPSNIITLAIVDTYETNGVPTDQAFAGNQYIYGNFPVNTNAGFIFTMRWHYQ